MTDNSVKLLSPVKSPLSIDEIRLNSRDLRSTVELSTINIIIVMTDKVLKLSSPAKSPLSIDGIWFLDKNL
jgi:hypothetical protein